MQFSDNQALLDEFSSRLMAAIVAHERFGDLSLFHAKLLRNLAVTILTNLLEQKK